MHHVGRGSAAVSTLHVTPLSTLARPPVLVPSSGLKQTDPDTVESAGNALLLHHPPWDARRLLRPPRRLLRRSRARARGRRRHVLPRGHCAAHVPLLPGLLPHASGARAAPHRPQPAARDGGRSGAAAPTFGLPAASSDASGCASDASRYAFDASRCASDTSRCASDASGCSSGTSRCASGTCSSRYSKTDSCNTPAADGGGAAGSCFSPRVAPQDASDCGARPNRRALARRDRVL